jgi:hypothetical protein
LLGGTPVGGDTGDKPDSEASDVSFGDERPLGRQALAGLEFIPPLCFCLLVELAAYFLVNTRESVPAIT